MLNLDLNLLFLRFKQTNFVEQKRDTFIDNFSFLPHWQIVLHQKLIFRTQLKTIVSLLNFAQFLGKAMSKKPMLEGVKFDRVGRGRFEFRVDEYNKFLGVLDEAEIIVDGRLNLIETLFLLSEPFLNRLYLLN